METTESNKLIAEFMNLQTPDGCYFEHLTKNGDTELTHCILLQYHTCWNWLMPVVKKCLEIYHIELMYDDLNFEFYDCIGDIENTYNEVVQFIKNYNTI